MERTSDGRRPDAVRFSTDPREDVLRRDFTINGMLLDPIAFEARRSVARAASSMWLEGSEDLKAGIIRAIGEPSLRFAEDKLRMLRAVRFAARLGFEIEPQNDGGDSGAGGVDSSGVVRENAR